MDRTKKGNGVRQMSNAVRFYLMWGGVFSLMVAARVVSTWGPPW